MPDPYLPALRAELRTHGIRESWVDHNHPHPRLYWLRDGRQTFYVMPSTPGDRRGLDNALSDLRRILGVRRVVHHSTREPSRRNRTEAAMALTLTVRPDPLAALAGMARDIERRGRDAGLRLFLAGCGLAGHEAPEVRAGWWDAVWVVAW